MQNCFLLSTNSAQINYTVVGSNNSQIQKTNTITTLIYNASLSVFFYYSNWYLRHCTAERENFIIICNTNHIKLYNICINICFDQTSSKYYCYINSSKYSKYQNINKNFFINIPNLSSGEIFYFKFKSIKYLNDYNPNEKIKITIYAQVHQSDKSHINVCNSHMYNYV